jgi:signal peptidase I
MSRTDATFDDRHALKCELAAEVLRSSGTLRLKVTGTSMLPTVFPGDTLIVEHADFANAQAGDIVLVGRNGRLFAHRLVDKIAVADRSAALTKGDSMAHADPLVDRDKVLGRVSSILRNGETLQPRRKLRLSERAVAALIQRSEMAGRVVVGVYGFRSPAPNHKF